MEWLLSITSRSVRKLPELQFQKAPFLQIINNLSKKMYSRRVPSSNTSKLQSLQKQLGFLKSRALDEQRNIDAKIAKLQKRIERIRKQLKEATSKRVKELKEQKKGK